MSATETCFEFNIGPVEGGVQLEKETIRVNASVKKP